MNKRNFLIGFLLLAACITAYSQVVVVDGGEDGPSLRLTGEVVGMMTLGFAGEEQAYSPGTQAQAPGIYYRDTSSTGNLDSGKNGYYSSINFSFLFNPVYYVDIYMKLLAQYRPGSPYLPLQLEDNSAKTFEDFGVDSAYGRVNAIKGLGLDIPLDVWIKAGKFDTGSAQYNRVSEFGAESVMSTMKTMNRYGIQLEAAYTALPGIEAVSAVVTTNLRLNETLSEFFDEDVSQSIAHGSVTRETVIPIHTALRMKNLTLPLGKLSAELLYAYNGMDIFSGHSFGADVGWDVPLVDDTFIIPVGIGAVFHEKNIDVLAGTSIKSDSSEYLKLYTDGGYHSINDINTKGLRQALRIGFGTGARYKTDFLAADFNLGFAYNTMAHIYRDTLSLPSLSVDLRAILKDHYFIGGGIFLGALVETEWNTKSNVDNTKDISTHVFTLAENMGWEIYGGLQFKKARFVIGYNMNKGLSMNNSIESIPEAQIKYKQKDTLLSDGLFERGGLFTKLVISW